MMSNQESLNSTPKSSKRFLPLVILVLLIAGGGAWAFIGREPSTPQNVNVQQAKTIDVTIVATAKGDEMTREIVSVAENATVLEAMESSSLDLGIKEYSFGKTIETINGVGGEENTYWLYSLNDTPAMEGVSTQRVNAGDVITWTYGG